MAATRLVDVLFFHLRKNKNWFTGNWKGTQITVGKMSKPQSWHWRKLKVCFQLKHQTSKGSSNEVMGDQLDRNESQEMFWRTKGDDTLPIFYKSRKDLTNLTESDISAIFTRNCYCYQRDQYLNTNSYVYIYIYQYIAFKVYINIQALNLLKLEPAMEFFLENSVPDLKLCKSWAVVGRGRLEMLTFGNCSRILDLLCWEDRSPH